MTLRKMPQRPGMFDGPSVQNKSVASGLQPLDIDQNGEPLACIVLKTRFPTAVSPMSMKCRPSVDCR